MKILKLHEICDCDECLKEFLSDGAGQKQNQKEFDMAAAFCEIANAIFMFNDDGCK